MYQLAFYLLFPRGSIRLRCFASLRAFSAPSPSFSSPTFTLPFSTPSLTLHPSVWVHTAVPFPPAVFSPRWLSLYRYTDASRFIPGNCLLNSRGMRHRAVGSPRATPSRAAHFSIHPEVCTRGPEGKRPTELFSRYRENMPEGRILPRNWIIN